VYFCFPGPRGQKNIYHCFGKSYSDKNPTTSRKIVAYDACQRRPTTPKALTSRSRRLVLGVSRRRRGRGRCERCAEQCQQEECCHRSISARHFRFVLTIRSLSMKGLCWIGTRRLGHWNTKEHRAENARSRFVVSHEPGQRCRARLVVQKPTRPAPCSLAAAGGTKWLPSASNLATHVSFLFVACSIDAFVIHINQLRNSQATFLKFYLSDNKPKGTSPKITIIIFKTTPRSRPT
jgi:hypothetical protein